jgi:hypothetical protein
LDFRKRKRRPPELPELAELLLLAETDPQAHRRLV